MNHDDIVNAAKSKAAYHGEVAVFGALVTLLLDAVGEHCEKTDAMRFAWQGQADIAEVNERLRECLMSLRGYRFENVGLDKISDDVATILRGFQG